MTEMQCFLQTGPTAVLMGGHQNTLIEYDLASNREIRLVSKFVHVSVHLGA